MKYSDAMSEVECANKLFQLRVITRAEYEQALNSIRWDMGLETPRNFEISDSGEIREQTFRTIEVSRFEPDK
jgi:hypothetical protein